MWRFPAAPHDADASLHCAQRDRPRRTPNPVSGRRRGIAEKRARERAPLLIQGGRCRVRQAPAQRGVLRPRLRQSHLRHRDGARCTRRAHPALRPRSAPVPRSGRSRAKRSHRFRVRLPDALPDGGSAAISATTRPPHVARPGSRKHDYPSGQVRARGRRCASDRDRRAKMGRGRQHKFLTRRGRSAAGKGFAFRRLRRAERTVPLRVGNP